MPLSEPGDPRGAFARLMAKIRACKIRRTCRRLQTRSFYFEPNPATIAQWRTDEDKLQAYSGPIDRRVMFVCESPGGQVRDGRRVEPRRCWAVTRQDRAFFKMRKRYGLDNCYLTNSVKCGVRPQKRSRHADVEIDACGGFLESEMRLIAPLVAVGVGGNAMLALRRAARRMKNPPVLFQITHYSARGRKAEQEWRHEMPELRRLLTRLRPRTEWSRARP